MLQSTAFVEAGLMSRWRVSWGVMNRSAATRFKGKFRFCSCRSSTENKNSGAVVHQRPESRENGGDEGLMSSTEANRLRQKPDTCTGDELHYISVANGKWKLALWRYLPVCNAPVRNHPLLLLSGVATNALGFDLDPSVSFARYMAENGFDTWILEMRAAGLSKQEEQLLHDLSTVAQKATENRAGAEAENLKSIQEVASTASKLEPELNETINTIKKQEEQQQGNDKEQLNEQNGSILEKPPEEGSSWEITRTVSQLSNVVMELTQNLRAVVKDGQSKALSARLAEQLSSVLEDAQLSHRYQEIKDRLMKLLEERKNSAFSSQLVELNNRLTRLLEEAQVSVSRVKDLQERLTTTVDEFQKFLELILKYDWDFDHYLEEDLPAAMDYIKDLCNPADGKLFGIGHSMGGILLYASVATKGKETSFAAVVTLASSLDYSNSNSTLHMLLPLADPAQLLNVPVVPLGAIMQAMYPLISRPPYALAWLGSNVSASGMMDPELYKKLVHHNFCTVPAKLLLQLTTAFQSGGLKNRDGQVNYKDLLAEADVPVLAIAGDADLICPPPAVIDTVELLGERGEQQVFGGEGDKHYGHYDLLVSRTAKAEVFPVILKFIEKHDRPSTSS